MGDKKELPACDLVLEGGVTSALIYTGLIARLSEHYRFKNLGGTSSGAASAAAGAIAQRARLDTPVSRNKMHRAFKALRDFPKDLAKPAGADRTVLFRLFQPQAGTRKGFDIVATYLEHSRPGRSAAAVGHALAAIVRNFPIPALAGAMPGAVFLFLALRPLWQGATPDAAHWLAAVFAAVLTPVLALLVAGVWALSTTLRGMLHNHFGLCSGMKGVGYGEDAPLTYALHALYNGLRGRSPRKRPVTFEDLWGKAARKGGEREIDLQVITTALNLRRPFRLPNDPGIDPLRGFFYDPNEWAQLFPPVVMAWLARNRRLGAGPLVVNERGVPLRSLPEPGKWPVLVAVRLSLSFPGLLSAVPMYTLEQRPQAKPGQQAGQLPFIARKVYFSDGGITSNCPIQLFDAPLPGHPTFGVRLDNFKTGDGGRHRVWLPDDAAPPPPRVRAFDTRSRVHAAVAFVAGIVGTAIEWTDRLQRTLPGYRERIVVVSLKPDEGGLNLAMTPETIGRVAALGSRAARRLHEAFDGPRTDGRSNAWDRHRWLRLRSTLAAAQRYVADVGKARAASEVDYRGLLDTRPSIDPRLVDPIATERAKELLDGLADLANGEVPRRDLEENASRPAPRLRMSSPW